MNLENSLYRIHPLKKFDKEIILPTSKSHSNRALIMGAIQGGNFKVHNLSTSTDVTHLLNAFKKIGLRIHKEGTTVTFLNSFPGCEKESTGDVIEIMTGDGGTTNRFLIALLARGKKEYHLRPSEKMNERPIDDLIEPLKKISVQIVCNQDKNNPEPWIKMKGPASLYNTTKLVIDCSKSTQFASALMLAFSNIPLKFDYVNLKVSETYVRMTTRVIQKSLEDNSYTIPVDFSSLGYPAALAALMGRVIVKNCMEMDVFQADSAFIKLLAEIGAQTTFSQDGLEIKQNAALRPFSYDVSSAPDLFPTLVFLASHIEGVSTLSYLEVLRFKESDRLKEMISMMKDFGVKYSYSEAEDAMTIFGSHKTYPTATIRPVRDHRIVMTAALFMWKNAGGHLGEVDCVEKSFPNFLTLLE